MDPSDGAETGSTMSKKKPHRQAKPDRPSATKVAEAGTDAPRGENAREELGQAAVMLDQMKKIVESGLHALDTSDPSIIEKVEIKQAEKVAKQVQKLCKFSHEWTHPAIGNIFSFINDIEPYACVDAWHEVLVLLKERGLSSLDATKAVASEIPDISCEEHPIPCLAKRMCLNRAIRNAGEVKIRKILADKSLAPRDKAFELARWALKGRNVNANSAFAIKKSYERLRALQNEGDARKTQR